MRLPRLFPMRSPIRTRQAASETIGAISVRGHVGLLWLCVRVRCKEKYYLPRGKTQVRQASVVRSYLGGRACGELGSAGRSVQGVSRGGRLSWQGGPAVRLIDVVTAADACTASIAPVRRCAAESRRKGSGARMGAARFADASRTAPKTAMRDAWAGPAVVRHVAVVQVRFSHGRERFGCFGAQRYRGRECARCNIGYYPWFDDCAKCPDPFGWTAKNALTVVYRYGTIWLLWMVINRILYVDSAIAPTAAAALSRVSARIGIVGVTSCSWQTRMPALPCPALPCPALPCPALPCPALPCPG